MATKIHHGISSTKVVGSWILEGRLEGLVEIIHFMMALTFNHIKRNGNKLAYLMENLDTETHQSVKAKNWAYVSDTIA